MKRFLSFLAALGATTAAAAQTTTAKRAKAFQLESLSPAAPAATPEAPPPAPSTPVPDAAATTPADATAPLRPSFTLDTPIAVLIADPAARAVLDRDLPGLSSDENLDKFARLGLRQFQPLTGGQLTDAMLLKVAGHLSALGGPMLAPIVPPAAGGASKRNRDTSR